MSMPDKMLLVDKIFCITLKHREDRQRYALENLDGVFGQLELWRVEKDIENPERGCFTSHQGIAQYGIENGCDRILVFEDDATLPRRPRLREIHRINGFLNRELGDLLHLGGIVGEAQFTRFRGITKGSLFCTHAYIITRRGMNKLAGMSYEGFPIDVQLFNDFDCYASMPLLVDQLGQEVSSSDIAGKRNDEACLTSAFWKKNKINQYKVALKTAISSLRRSRNHLLNTSSET